MADTSITKQSVPLKLIDLGDGTFAVASVEQKAPFFEDNVANVAKVEQRFSPTYISSATTTVVKPGAGYLQRIVITETAAGTISIYDNTAASGPPIAVFKASVAEGSYEFNCTFVTGLTIVTAAATKLTVVTR